MKLIADEGVDQPIVASLRVAKFDVTYYAELAPGSDDASILEHAQQAHTLLLTCDKDFGELVFRNRLITAGVVLIRLEGLSADKKARLVTEAVRLHSDQMLNSFSVVSPGMVRIRRSDAT
jgi:predicted nuclease of predicted toxin-antitoxin system